MAAIGAACLTLVLAAQNGLARGVRDPAWSPDGRRLATSYFDRIWISPADGRGGRELRADATGIERDPAWSPDGRALVFAADAGDGFDIVVTDADGRNARQLTSTPGDERWPTWTRDGRIVFSRREAPLANWRLHVIDAAGGGDRPLFDDAAADSEFDGVVSPDGKRIAYVSDRESDDGDVDLWIADLPPDARGRSRRTRLTRIRGVEASPSWSPDGLRLAFFAQREGMGSVWVSHVDPPAAGDPATSEAQPAGANPTPSAVQPSRPSADVPRSRPSAPAQLVSRRGGAPAWTPDGRKIAIAEFPPADPSYNGNPLRNTDEPPPLFMNDGFRLWTVDAPLPIDSGSQAISHAGSSGGGSGSVASAFRRKTFAAVFDRVWETLRRLYYAGGAGADQWRSLRDRYRRDAENAENEEALEDIIDAMIAEQPLIKPAVTSNRAMVVSGHPLASQAGALMLERGGNIVDAAIAVSFVLGVVEPEASGIGGDGMAVLYLEGMREPVVIDYKDQVPIRATADNPVVRQNSGDGPAAANIPGVVGGLDFLYRRYGSRKVSWEQLVAPAIDHADNGFVLDAALPTSIAEGRRFFQKYPASRRIYLPDGKVPKPGDRFINKDYASTLRSIARGGADGFYRGDIARRIAADMAKNGGLITLDDLAQYRAIERRPLAGRYRDHVVFSAPPPVSSGLGLIETLQILENYRPKAGAAFTRDADYLHYAIESWKVRDQSGRIADPAFWDVNLGPHLDLAHAAELFKRIDPAKASRNRPEPPRTETPERIGRGTTAFAVADAEGNMIAVTQTLSTWGGTFYVSDGLGFLYNNHLRFGGGGAPGRFLPLARSSSTSAPTLVFRKSQDADRPGTPRLATAAAGNAWITASVYEIILNVIDSGLAVQRAIEAPRFLVGRDPLEPAVSRMQIEDRFPRRIIDDLTARGHRFQKIGRKGEVRYGYAAAIVLDAEKKEVHGGAEPRRSHASAAPR